MAKPKNSKTLILSFTLILLLLIGFTFVLQNTFAAPRTSSPTFKYRVPEAATTMAITGDLKYYGFVKHESALKVALLLEGKIRGKDVQRSSVYEISQSMTTWQIANVLLNKGVSMDCSHGCHGSNFDPELLPGGDLAPTITQKYEWVKTYEDCVKSIGHDGGQLSSEQYAQRTGIRKCVSPDGREFTQGKEGWTTAVGG
jgi:cell division protein YceG involved in septum cleavage